MADFCAVYTVAGLTLNAASPSNTYLIENIDGLDGVPIRRTVDPRPQTDGAILFPAFKDARHITFEGLLLVRSADPYLNPTGYQAALNALESAMVSGLDATINADTTLAWPGNALTVRRDELPAGFRGRWPEKRFIFSLICASP